MKAVMKLLYDFIIADKNSKTPMYRQIYRSVRAAIETGSLKKNDRMPSIRALSAELKISKTTVIAAYEQLCAEGYILTRPQSGYYVAADFQNPPKTVENTHHFSNEENKYVEYDFSTKSIDSRIANSSAWRKEIKEIINKSYLLTSYGDVQGEEALRHALAKYALGLRSVHARASHIVVGAGTQAVLWLLCSLLERGQRVALQQSSFVQSEYVFRGFGYDIAYFDSDEYGVTIESLEKIRPGVVLINPNFSGQKGLNMPVTRRLELIRWAAGHNALIIEDDYNGELRYSSHPVPCVQNHDAEHTVYIGSFSKVLLPSVRISYMVLPDALMERFRISKGYLNQTASKTEQLALAAYINSGKIDSHIRKARRIYDDKSRVTLSCIEKYLPGSEVVFNETSMYVTVRLPYPVNRTGIDKDCKAQSIRLMPYKKADNEFGVSFSGIPIERIDDGIRLLSEIIHKHKQPTD